MIRLKLLVVVTSAWLALAIPTRTFADPIYSLKVNVVQVFDDAGGNGTPLDPSNNANLGYLYQSKVNEIWAQAGIQVNFNVTTWNSSAAQRLTSNELSALYANTFAGAPGIATDALQIFFVKDHPGTGYNGTAGTGWVDNPLANPLGQARNAGNNQLFIDGTFTSIGRGVMTNEGFAREDLARTLAHEIGHGLGLRHVDEMPVDAGSVQDPRFTLSSTTANLMWSAGQGPVYNFALNADPNLTVLQENARLNSAQIAAAIYNGTRLDPDGNGFGVLRLIAVPEPSTACLWIFGTAVVLHRRRSCGRA